jgi:hypothetical protein
VGMWDAGHTMSIRSLERTSGIQDRRPSYLYHWYDLDLRTFASLGVICRRDPEDDPVFNFKQKAMLGVPMDWKRRYTKNVEALAANILLQMQYPTRRIYQPVRGAGFISATTVVEAFARDHFLTMDRAGGHIPRDQITTWCTWHLPNGSHRP